MGLLDSVSRETKYISNVLRVLRSIRDVKADSDNLICDDLEKVVERFRNNIAFIEDDRTLTFDEFEIYSNRVAGWAMKEGCKAGDTVAVFSQNRLEYVAIWYGLSKIGVTPALLNFQLTGPALTHCINISDCRLLIVDHELMDNWKTAAKKVKHKFKVLSAFEETPGFDSFDAALLDITPDRPAKALRKGIKAGDLCMKMFTSGTTGMPKAAKVSHARVQNYMRAFASAAQTKPTDRMLMVLPMYHATGGLCGVGAAITNGGAVIVRRRFSASRFWDEAVDYGATLFMYVGELCRFLLQTPVHPNEREHNIRWIIGNGLRPEVWPSFVSRFNIPHVIEFYGATEGNVSLANIDGKVGAVGRVPDYLRSRFNCDIIRYDVETESNPRGSDGFCIRTDPDEIGELIGEIRTDDARFRFDGYENKAATNKKILRNVLKKGDAWFKTGDLMKRDAQGYFYFMDRVGDTYRWKAENVATGEVASVLDMYKGITQANVYGVSVPGYDGRAGMAAIVAENDIDMAALKAHIDASLPIYARPVFLRISKESETTSTFKFKKVNLVKAGFNPANISDPLYYANSQSGAYERITPQIYEDILSGTLRL